MEKSCSECSEPSLAQSLCTLCNKWLCYQCTDVHQHQRAPTTSQYTDLHPQQRPGATQHPDLHQKGSTSLPSTGQGPGSYPCSLLMCHSHRQEPLELFCESCDLLCCSSCQLSSHKNHRVVQINKALQDQQWLFENLMVRVEEKRSAVESNAKQIEDRLHGVKIAHRKAENQIKMAKMIMINELNKRANLLIEQLQKISEDFQQRLEDQLQGAIETSGQLDNIQKFVTWATTHHSRDPVLFSRTLISLQMQQLLEPTLHSDSWSPIKIKFNWDASYWTKQISTLGQLTVEGGTCTSPQGLACSSILRPPPITCLVLPSLCHRTREPGCGYQACCEPQMCCLHGIPSQPDLSTLDKSQLEATFCNSRCNSSCVQPALISASLRQSQQLQRCWDPNSSSQCPPPSPPVPIIEPIQLVCSQGSTSHGQATASQPQPQMKSYFYHEYQTDVLPDNQAQSGADHSKLSQCQGKLLTSTALQQDLSLTGLERDGVTEDIWEERCRVEEVGGQTDSRDLLGEEQQDNPVKQRQQPQLHVFPARKELERNRPALMLRQGRSESYIPLPRGMDQRSTSLEVSVTALRCESDMQRSRLSPTLVCTTRKRRSQSIPTELAAPSTTPCSERPTGCTLSLEAGAANKFASKDSRQRRPSDGVLCVVKETSSDMAPSRGHQSPLLTYKAEPGLDRDAMEKCRVSRNGHNSNTDVQKDSGRPRVPVVCLERLKILVSQLPPHGRRQSDPLPVSVTQRNETLSQQRTSRDATPDGIAGGCVTTRTNHSLTPPSYAEYLNCYESSTHSTTSEFDHQGDINSHKASMLPFSEPKFVPKRYSALDFDSDPRSDREEDAGASWVSSSEAEKCLPGRESVTTGELGRCAGTDIPKDSEPSLECDADPDSDAGAGSEDGQQLDADAESCDAETESDTQPDSNPSFQAETDSDVSDQHPDSQGSVESELNIESEHEVATDDPQPLRSDLEEESHIGPGQRALLKADPVPQTRTEVQSDQDNAEVESEDFCAVCLIGGDLLCCDRCPKVFHLSCHVPSLLSFPSGDWVCSLCRDAVQPEAEYDCEDERRPGEHTMAQGMPAYDQRKCERLTLLILSNVLSAPFQEPVSPLARHYYQIIKRPMDLSMIRAKLNRRNARRYNSPEQFVADVCLMFRNCAKFNYPDSEVAQAGRSLEAFFISKLKEVFPDRVFPAAEVDSDSDEYDEACRTAEGGFPWPERREQCHRKRKRRNSLKSRRHHF